MGKYQKQFKGIAIAIEEETKEYITKYAITLVNNLVLATPVRTGRARGGWIVSVNRPDDYVAQLISKSGAAVITNAIKRINNNYKSLDDVIYVQNNLPYIVPLDRGSSDQAPYGIKDRAVKQTDVQFAYGNF